MSHFASTTDHYAKFCSVAISRRFVVVVTFSVVLFTAIAPSATYFAFDARAVTNHDAYYLQGYSFLRAVGWVRATMTVLTGAVRYPFPAMALKAIACLVPVTPDLLQALCVASMAVFAAASFFFADRLGGPVAGFVAGMIAATAPANVAYGRQVFLQFHVHSLVLPALVLALGEGKHAPPSQRRAMAGILVASAIATHPLAVLTGAPVVGLLAIHAYHARLSGQSRLADFVALASPAAAIALMFRTVVYRGGSILLKPPANLPRPPGIGLSLLRDAGDSLGTNVAVAFASAAIVLGIAFAMRTYPQRRSISRTAFFSTVWWIGLTVWAVVKGIGEPVNALAYAIAIAAVSAGMANLVRSFGRPKLDGIVAVVMIGFAAISAVDRTLEFLDVYPIAWERPSPRLISRDLVAPHRLKIRTEPDLEEWATQTLEKSGSRIRYHVAGPIETDADASDLDGTRFKMTDFSGLFLDKGPRYVHANDKADAEVLVHYANAPGRGMDLKSLGRVIADLRRESNTRELKWRVCSTPYNPYDVFLPADGTRGLSVVVVRTFASSQ